MDRFICFLEINDPRFQEKIAVVSLMFWGLYKSPGNLFWQAQFFSEFLKATPRCRKLL